MSFKNSCTTFGLMASTLALAGLAGLAASAAHSPLPWMLGPLFGVAALRTLGLPLLPPPGGRQAGQWAIGASLGLYFTAQVLDLLRANVLLVSVLALSALLIGLLCALLTLRLAASDRPTAFFASLPGGASEMAVIAERFGGAVDRIAAAHALRVMLVVALVPFGLSWFGAHGSDVYLPLATTVEPARLPWLLASSLCGVGALTALRVGNAWVLGPLLGVGLATAFGVELSALPVWAVNGGQLLIGCALGCRFSPEFFHAAPRFLAAAAMSALLAVGLGCGLAVMVSAASGVPLATLVLAAAPGGVAEMCITAKVLQLGVPLVTVCHVLRVIVLTVGAPGLYRLFLRMTR
ncbi:AbrB family transcriptional regulator [Denitromonas ohlonensis]|uniref:AbrB family transcriptional regulator n=2 Tax=Denitromonas TaxID=139331 RepID=A0A557RT90_9RHOO|nr:AbrB family transcriptional regulator [Denitromonas ohlonensis]TVO68379.1 AbrB family transcriptional regulator [Denitromonas ohlonensis]TVO74657.1 AbrB family transcriptional regulator [Denitromonas ohlonensis]TVT51054.1 MAG: AbrB family transcriptional regulator [Denitromonas halophila]TVT67415.1 MAG: AbrB family transcriptional regulator [Denitromonas halophila]